MKAFWFLRCLFGFDAFTFSRGATLKDISGLRTCDLPVADRKSLIEMAEDVDEANNVNSVNLPYGKRMKLSRSEDDDNKTGGENQLLWNQNALDYLHLYFNGNAQEKSKITVVFDNGKGRTEELSYESLDTFANRFKEMIGKLLGSESQFIGVMCGLGILYPILILGILRSGRAFFNVDFENWGNAIRDGVKYLKLKYIICESESLDNNAGTDLNIILEWSLPEVNLKCVVYEVVSKSPYVTDFELVRTGGANSRTIAYAIQTSGTTGQRKMVLVPHSCICPNIQSFIDVNWNVSYEDVIFGAAPPTFDPQVVELFTALGTGATIVYSTSAVKSDSRLINLLMKYCVTILQVTPSVFRRMSQYLEKGKCLPTLRMVGFGGEKCVTKQEIKEILTTNAFHPNIRFQNVYGVTEVSCLASVSNINLQTDDPITVGEGIMETEVAIALDEFGDEGEIVIKSSTRCCHIIDSSNLNGEMESISAAAERTQMAYEYRTGDIGRVTKFGIVFEGREDRVVKRNGMKVSLYQIEEMAYSTGLVSFAECRLHSGKVYLLVKLKPEYEALHYNSTSCKNSSVTLVPFLSSKLELPLFMYPDAIISMQRIPLNSNGKIDFPHVINSVMMTKDSSESIVPFSVSSETVLKSITPVWKSCTWPGERTLEQLSREHFYDAGGTSISAARFVESAFMALKPFGSQVHQTYEKELLLSLANKTFAEVVDFVFNIIRLRTPITANVSDLNLELLVETQDKLSYPIDHHTESELLSEFEYKMLEVTNLEEDDDLPVFNEVDVDRTQIKLEELMEFPFQFITMHDFTLGLCVDASPTITSRNGCMKDRVIIDCHGGVLLCVDLNVLRLRHAQKSPHLAIAWKRRMPRRIEAAVAIDKDGLYGYVGCHDSNFYKFSVVRGAIVCSLLCHALIRSKAELSAEHEIVVFIDADNCIYAVNSHDLNVIWCEKAFKLLGTATPLIIGSRCYVTTLDNGLVFLDIRTGITLWDWDGRNNCYTSPILGHMISSNGKKKKRKSVIISGTLNNTSQTTGVDIRDTKTGSILWQNSIDAAAAAKSQIVNRPLFSKCCDKIIWISADSQQLIIFNPQETGNDFSQSILHIQPNTTCSIVRCASECVLFYKIPEMTGLAFVNLHEGVLYEIKPWFLKQKFESFSIPSICGEFILFGGRDNKLHVIQCHKIKTNINAQ